MSRAPTGELVDAEDRRRIAEDLDRTFVVEAAAGTGKTTSLVRRIAGLVCHGGVDIAHIVAASFTERAAGEIVLRLRAELERRRSASSPAERTRAERAIQHLEEARIGTIHRVAATLLRERPIEAGLEPDFTMLSPGDADALRSRALRTWMGPALKRGAPGLSRFLRRAGGRDDDNPIARLENVFGKVAEHRDLTAPWTRTAGRNREIEIDWLVNEIRALGALADRASSQTAPLARLFLALARSSAAIDERELFAPRDYDALELELGALTSSEKSTWPAKGRGAEYGPGLAHADVIPRRDALLARLSRLGPESQEELASLVREELAEPLRIYESLKERAGALDFLDIAIRLSRLLEESAEARRSLAHAARYVLCDEVQDCDPRELDILRWLALAEGESDARRGRLAPGRLFVVGDPKQAIYGFRRASLGAYIALRDELAGRGAERLTLRSNFRSTPSICGVVDRALEGEFVESRHQAGYVALSPTLPDPSDAASVIALPVPRPYGTNGRVAWYMVEDALPALVARHVAWMVRESGWPVRDPETGERRPMRFSDVALLFKGMKRAQRDVGASFARALEALDVPHAYPGGISFHEQPEVAALRAALVAIEWPDDSRSVFATLRGPFVALSDGALLSYVDRVGSLSPFHVPMGDARDALEADVREVADALDRLRALHVQRRHRSIPSTIEAFLDGTRARVSLALASNGEIALARVTRVLDQARRAESEGALSFRAFVEALEAQAEAMDDEMKRGRDAVEGVRLLSAHGAKGLEFPVVVLADPTVSVRWKEAGRYIDVSKGLWAESVEGLRPRELNANGVDALAIDAGEATRLLYVAATRARDVLVVPTTGVESLGAWIDPLERALRRAATQGKHTGTSAPGAPAFGERTVFDDDADAPTGVRPGTYEHDGVRVTFWDPATLTGQAPRRQAIRGLELVQKGDGDDEGKAARAHLEARTRVTTDAAVGARDVLGLVDAARLPLAAAAMEAEVDVVEVLLEPAHDAARGRRASALLRRLVSQLPVSDAALAAEVAAVRATPEERALCVAALDTIARVPAVAGALASSALLRDQPAALSIGARTVGEGRVALLVAPREGDVLAIDATLERGDDVEAARGALALCATAVGRAMDRSARAILVVV